MHVNRPRLALCVAQSCAICPFKRTRQLAFGSTRPNCGTASATANTSVSDNRKSLGGQKIGRDMDKPLDRRRAFEKRWHRSRHSSECLITNFSNKCAVKNKSHRRLWKVSGLANENVDLCFVKRLPISSNCVGQSELPSQRHSSRGLLRILANSTTGLVSVRVFASPQRCSTSLLFHYNLENTPTFLADTLEGNETEAARARDVRTLIKNQTLTAVERILAN